LSSAGGPGIRPRACRSCQVEVYDLLYLRTGKTAPIEVRPSANGNVLIDLEAGTYSIVTGEALALAGRGQAELHVNHYVSCPQAAAWHARSTKKVTSG